MEVIYRFVNYGEELDPAPDTLVLDVGMKTVPGVIDHHHPLAESECAASLVAKSPGLVLGHVPGPAGPKPGILRIITHRMPDFDAVASIFLALRLIETKTVDSAMEKIAGYARLVDSSSLPKTTDLASSPYGILRALFSVIRGREEDVGAERVSEGLAFMRFLHQKSVEGHDFTQNRTLFTGIERYEKAMRRVEEDYFRYLDDLGRSPRLSLSLPETSGEGRRRVDGLVVVNPKSFLLKEWARRDCFHSRQGKGFSFLMSSFGEERHFLGVDPDEGVHLKGLGPLLDRREGSRRKSLGKGFPSPWYGGDGPFFQNRIVVSPRDGSVLDREEILAAVEEFGKTAP